MSTSLGDIRDIACTVDGLGPSRALRFDALLAGGHDDTSASMRATIDGQAIAQGRLDEALGLAIGLWPIGSSELVPDADAASCSDRAS